MSSAPNSRTISAGSRSASLPPPLRSTCQTARNSARRCLASSSVSPIATALPPLARYATLQCGRRRADRRLHRSEPRLQAPLPALPDCAGLRRALPDRARARSSWRTSARRSPRAPDTSRSATRTSSTASATPLPSSRAFHAEFPEIIYDVTIKIEHLLHHATRCRVLRDTGCAFVTSAVESVDDDVLAKLEKGHTRADFERAVALCREAGLTLAPTFVAFTPWTTLEAYCSLLQAHRSARTRRARRADPARDPPADYRRLAAARAAGDSRDGRHRSIRPR